MTNQNNAGATPPEPSTPFAKTKFLITASYATYGRYLVEAADEGESIDLFWDEVFDETDPLEEWTEHTDIDDIKVLAGDPEDGGAE